ncbi:alpha-1,6-glucosidase domain-containing protein [Colwellia sp. RSH04]|uniref:alpha-1,6-glucosidase domain-containing protein n=1 Tax=Colwellia sp. RSH04 TaxID=2305464 RepID=UPI000E5876C7|nr:alpha-1,6-glucosidase domain-containing protein [Colwellia sp. RSH04]RHW77758.1 DUF3372 domain-containing protein [Colwellia sp. RSH04]
MKITTSVKQVFLYTSLSITLAACGGGGGGEETTPITPPTPTNSAPTISSFASNIDDFAVTFTWSVADSDNDALSCVLSPGGTLDDVTISDCSATTSTVVTYPSAGEFSASFSVTDTSSASAQDSLVINISDPNALPEPIVTAGDNQLVIFYNRPDANYEGWILHLWNNSECDAYADFASDAGTDWATGQAQSGLDPNYGAYWLIELKDNASDCANFIVHKGDDKDIGGIDHKADLSGERMIWTLSGISELYSQATLYPSGVLIADTAAHWVNLETVFWQVNSNTQNTSVSKVRIYSSDVDDMGYDGEAGIAGDNYIEFLAQANNATELGMPRYKDLSGFVADSADSSKAKQMLTCKLLAIAYDSSDKVLAATYVQTPRVLDALYTENSDDADEATLGVSYSGDTIAAALWAPTAQQVNLKVYQADKTLLSTHAMVVNSTTGVWSHSLSNNHDRLFYRYELTVYHPQNQSFETIESTDPYSVSLATNGDYSQFVNLADNDLKPAGWDEHAIPTVANPEDAIIYEGHIRDFSIFDQSTSAETRGKYLAFTEENSVPVQHLKSLVDSGLTHFQFLPANDIASINEDNAKTVNLTDTVADLCAVNSAAPVCGVEDNSATLFAVMESYSSNSESAQALVEAMRGIDSFNWGYDPKHFSAPDGSYASNPDGVARIIEMRAMNQALHEMGLRVVLDVVYNHTNSSGLWDNSVLDKVVPGYYHRRDLTSGNVINETCCQDTAPEHTMMDKLMADSLVLWTQAYKFDGFRFDIMSNNSVESILSAREAVQAVDADNYFYGEGWTRTDRGYLQAQQNNMAGSEVGTFNDRPRDVIRSATLFNSAPNLADIDIMRLGLAGTLANYSLQDKSDNIKLASSFANHPSYAKDPADIINYVSKHDNETLWDQLQYGIEDDTSISERVRMQNIAGTLPLMSQGITFLQLGGDLIRSKSLDRNTYDAGDWFNRIDFTKQTSNWNIGLPLAQDNQGKWAQMSALNNNLETQPMNQDIAFSSAIFQEFMSIRATSPLFRLTSEQAVLDRVGFHNTGSKQTAGLIVMSIDDGTGFTDLDSANDAIVVVINGSDSEQSHTILTAQGFELHSVQQNSADSIVQSASFSQNLNEGTFTVPALTTAVFVKPQQGAQGTGLAAGVTRDAPDIAPFGDTAVYLRGTMTSWDDSGLTLDESFEYQGNGIYQMELSITAGAQSFRLTSADAVVLDLGFTDLNVTNSAIALTNASGDIGFNAATSGSYQFILDASSEIPSLTVTSVSPSVDCSALADSNDDIPFDIAGSGQLFVKGDHSGWGADEAYRLHYKGNNTYQAVAEFSGDMQFKLASDDGNWATQLWAQADNSSDINGENLVLGVSYSVAYEDAGTNNNKTSLASGQYSFLLTLNEDNPAKGSDVGSLIIQQCQP